MEKQSQSERLQAIIDDVMAHPDERRVGTKSFVVEGLTDDEIAAKLAALTKEIEASGVDGVEVSNLQLQCSEGVRLLIEGKFLHERMDTFMSIISEGETDKRVTSACMTGFLAGIASMGEAMAHSRNPNMTLEGSFAEQEKTRKLLTKMIRDNLTAEVRTLVNAATRSIRKVAKAKEGRDEDHQG